MTFAVSGLDQYDAPYTAMLGMTGEQFEETSGEAFGESARISSDYVAGELNRAAGNPIGLTPTGPFVTLSDYDANSVLAWLSQNTTVLQVTGTPPPDARVPENDPELTY